MAAAPRRPAFVYFDLGNVIALFDRDRSTAAMAALAGVPTDAVHAALFAEGLQESLERGAIDWAGFHRRFGEATGSTTDPAALAHAASDMFTLNVPILPVIAALDRSGIRSGILSNTCAPHWSHILASRYSVLPGRFAVTVLSHEVGAMKPDPEIYRAAAAAAGVPGESIFFTDDVEEHVVAARRAGWDAEVFTSAHRLADQLERRGVNLGL